MSRSSSTLLLCCALWGCEGGGGSSESDPSPPDAATDTSAPAPDGAAPDATAPSPDARSEPDAAPPAPPLPAVWGPAPAEDLDPDPHVLEVNLAAERTQVALTDGSTIDMYAYNGQVPGPLLHARPGDTILVHFENRLDEPTTIHWHGLRIPDDMDGSPRIQDPVQPGESFTYRFVVPDAGSFWYHPHVRAHEQVEKGLYGPIIIREEAEPVFDVERYFVLDDILLDGDQIAPFMRSHMEQMHGRSGNVLLTNGNADPTTVQVQQGQVERWRVVNTANARTMLLRVAGAKFRVVGVDGGLLDEPFTTTQLAVAVGQRFDLEVKYDRAGRAELRSYVETLNANDQVVLRPFPLFAADVAPTGQAPRAVEWPAREPLADRPVNETVEVRFDGRQTANGLEWTLNGQAHAHEPMFTFRQGQVVRMRLVNEAGPVHPFHLHGQFFTIEDSPSGTSHPGLRDTVLLPGESTIVIQARLDNPGRWMAHCHILEHAELGMMTEFVVEPSP